MAYQTYGVVTNLSNSSADYTGISAKTSDGELESIVFKPFVDEETPHQSLNAIPIPPEEIDELIDQLEFIRMDYLRE